MGRPSWGGTTSGIIRTTTLGVDHEPVMVRAAEPGDVDQLNEIDNHYVRTSRVTFDILASVALHRRFGFSEVGRFTEQERKFGRYWDVAWFERPLP